MNICVEYKKYNVEAGLTVRWLTEPHQRRTSKGIDSGEKKKFNREELRASSAN